MILMLLVAIVFHLGLSIHPLSMFLNTIELYLGYSAFGVMCSLLPKPEFYLTF
jgi:hypothetical protein